MRFAPGGTYIVGKNVEPPYISKETDNWKTVWQLIEANEYIIEIKWKLILGDEKNR